MQTNLLREEKEAGPGKQSWKCQSGRNDKCTF